MPGSGVTQGPFGFPKLEDEERRRAIEDPGPSWKEWFFSSFAKVYLGLAWFVLDAILAATWLEAGLWVGAAGSVPAAAFLEYLAYQYLWFEPNPSRSVRSPGSRRPAPSEERPWARRVHRLVRPFPYGRWSHAAARARRGLPAVPDVDAGPDPGEFL